MTLSEFYQVVDECAKVNRWRIGQALFNGLTIERPELAEKLRATACDPFYSNTKRDKRYLKAVAIINAEWNK